LDESRIYALPSPYEVSDEQIVSTRSLKRGLLISLSGEALSKIPLYAFEFILASWLTLNDYAEWAALFLIFRFAPYCHLGALSYFNKRYPFLAGRELYFAKERVKLNTNLAINTVIIAIATFGLLFFISGYISAIQFFVICILIIMQMYTYCQSVVRNDGDFRAFTVGLLLFSFCQLLVALLLLDRFGILGATFSVFCGYLIAVIYYLFVVKVAYRLKLIRWRVLKRLLRVGFTPFLLTISAFLLQVSDRIALFFLDDIQKLAFYGFFALFMQLGIVIVNSAGKVLGPYILNLGGRKDVASTLYISIYNSYFIFIFYFLFSIGCYFLGDIILEAYFVNFTGSVIGVYNYATIGFMMAICMSFYPQLIVANKEFVVIVLNLCFSLILIVSIYYVAQAFSNYLAFTRASLLLNSIFSLVFLLFVERTLRVKLAKVKLVVSLMLVNTLLVNLYVWN
jgi:O-antigen/teichoic acid export membrane protein